MNSDGALLYRDAEVASGDGGLSADSDGCDSRGREMSENQTACRFDSFRTRVRELRHPNSRFDFQIYAKPGDF